MRERIGRAIRNQWTNRRRSILISEDDITWAIPLPSGVSGVSLAVLLDDTLVPPTLLSGPIAPLPPS